MKKFKIQSKISIEHQEIGNLLNFHFHFCIKNEKRKLRFSIYHENEILLVENYDTVNQYLPSAVINRKISDVRTGTKVEEQRIYFRKYSDGTKSKQEKQ